MSWHYRVDQLLLDAHRFLVASSITLLVTNKLPFFCERGSTLIWVSHASTSENVSLKMAHLFGTACRLKLSWSYCESKGSKASALEYVENVYWRKEIEYNDESNAIPN